MEKSPKPNISTLEIEIESKIAAAYLFSIVAQSRLLVPDELFHAHFKSIPGRASNNQFISNKSKNDENK
jgi:hypothetical protein